VEDIAARRDRGATAVEYAIMVSLIFVAIAVSVRAVGVQVDALFAAVMPGL
jgi:pilus assembly protein Flp/PilA